MPPSPHADECDPLWRSMLYLRKRRFAACHQACDALLKQSPRDQATIYLKSRTFIEEAGHDDAELDESSAGEQLLDETALASLPRPGTSISRPMTSQSGSAAPNSVASARRMTTGFVRPGSSSSHAHSTSGRSSSARVATSLGREVRLATASLALSSGEAAFIDTQRLNIDRLVRRRALAMSVAQYLLYHESNVRLALDIGAKATASEHFQDWWWKAFVGRCYSKLGLFREAERQLKSSLRGQDMILTRLELSNVYLRLDMPARALDSLEEARSLHTNQTALLLASARVCDALMKFDVSVDLYRQALRIDASSIEAMASLASRFFYSDQPELSLRFYRRLLQMGVHGVEVWNNLGLACFYSSQLDLSLNCFLSALSLAHDDDAADVWYNIGHVAIGCGDAALALQSWKIAVALDPKHAEAQCNIGVLESRRQNLESATSHLAASCAVSEPWLFEPFFNHALLHYKMGNFQQANEDVHRSLDALPGHSESKELKDALDAVLRVL